MKRSTGKIDVVIEGRSVRINIHHNLQGRAEHAAFAILVKRQARELAAQPLPSVTCPCGRRLSLARAYRCLYCELYLCRPCAKKHFGPNKD